MTSSHLSCLALFLFFLFPSSQQISEEIVSRHSPLTGRRTRGATPGLIKFEIVEMISGAATPTAILPSLYASTAVSPLLPECSVCLTGRGVFVCMSVKEKKCYFTWDFKKEDKQPKEVQRVNKTEPRQLGS